jgi:type IV pilus assembly protein PilO
MFKPGAVKTENYYTEVPVEISVYGGYHQVGSFLAEIANMRRIVNVSNIKLNTNTRGDGLASTTASLTASAYSLNTNASAGGATPASGAQNPKGGASNGHKDS